MGKKVTLSESELLKMIQQIVKENKSSEMDEQLFKNYKRRKSLKKALKPDEEEIETDEFDFEVDEKGEKKRQKKIRGGSIQTLLTDLANAEPPAWYAELLPTAAEVNGEEFKTEDGGKDYIKIMDKLVLNKLYTVYGSISAIAYFIRSSKDCNDRHIPETAENDSLKGLVSLDAYINKLKMYTKYLKGPVKGIIRGFLRSYGKTVKTMEKQGKEYFNEKNIRGAEGIFRDFQENYDRTKIMKQAFDTASEIILHTGSTDRKDPCHWDFE